MKNKIIAVLMTIMVCSTLFVGCGSKTEKEPETATKTETVEKDTSSKEDNTETGTYKNIEALFDDPDFNKEISESYEKMSNSIYDMSVSAEDNCLMITAKCKTLSYSDELVEQMEQAVESISSTMERQLTSLQSIVEDKDVSIIVTYVDKDDKTIISKTYKVE